MPRSDLRKIKTLVELLFETGKIEIHDNGEKIFFSSGVKFNIAPSSMKEEKN